MSGPSNDSPARAPQNLPPRPPRSLPPQARQSSPRKERPSEEPGDRSATKRAAKRAYTSRRPRTPHYEVRYLPPPWKRSLTESAMHRKITRLDVAAVLLFVLGFIGVVALLIQTGYA